MRGDTKSRVVMQLKTTERLIRSENYEQVYPARLRNVSGFDSGSLDKFLRLARLRHQSISLYVFMCTVAAEVRHIVRTHEHSPC